MRLLLDTHVFPWWSKDDTRLNAEVREAIEAADLVAISAASAWEAAIKTALGKLHIRVPFEDAVARTTASSSRTASPFSGPEGKANSPAHSRCFERARASSDSYVRIR